jgi:hypothetical protein
VINPEPAQLVDVAPPGVVFLVTGHNDMLDLDALAFHYLLLNLADSTLNGTERGEALVRGDIRLAPVLEVVVSHMNRDELQ